MAVSQRGFEKYHSVLVIVEFIDHGRCSCPKISGRSVDRSDAHQTIAPCMLSRIHLPLGDSHSITPVRAVTRNIIGLVACTVFVLRCNQSMTRINGGRVAFCPTLSREDNMHDRPLLAGGIVWGRMHHADAAANCLRW